MAFIRIKNIKNKSGKYYAYAYWVKNNWNSKLQRAEQKVIHYIGKVDGMNPIVAKEVFERDNSTCRYCGTLDNLTIDHIIPLTKGGNNNANNLQTLCQNCDSKKGIQKTVDWKTFQW